MSEYVYQIEQRIDEDDVEPVQSRHVYKDQYRAIEATRKWHYEMCDEIGYAPQDLKLTRESIQGHYLQPPLVLEPIVEGKRDPYMTYHIHQMKVVA